MNHAETAQGKELLANLEGKYSEEFIAKVRKHLEAIRGETFDAAKLLMEAEEEFRQDAYYEMQDFYYNYKMEDAA
ncbi:hypothetical protein HYZ99_01060 [Candidatus Peregrinibacteria bacterium]|nr:hypothetical protein [Candidatus Peregrinibacteria bacterium]